MPPVAYSPSSTGATAAAPWPKTIQGAFAAHPDPDKAFGFVDLDEATAFGPSALTSLFVPPPVLDALRQQGVHHGDRVRIHVAPGRDGRPVAAGPVQVLPSPPIDLVAVLRHTPSGAHAVFLDPRYGALPVAVAPTAVDRAAPAAPKVSVLPEGRHATVRIDRTKPGRPQAQVIELLDSAFNAQVSAAASLARHAIPVAFSEGALAAAAALPADVTEADKAGRHDLRALPLVTIDGTTTKDFDDAVHAAPDARGGWLLTVAIADVAHYVRAGAPLDQDARQRGTSVYLPARTVPMLPEALSNGLCSLNPRVDRLCMAAAIHVRPDGSLGAVRFDNALMHSHARLTYDRVARYLVDERHLSDDIGHARDRTDLPQGQRHHADAPMAPDVAASLDALCAVYNALAVARKTRGALEFETPDVMFLQDASGKIVEVLPEIRNVAHRLVEECMIAANVAAAQELDRAAHPALYRIHDLHPDTSRVTAMNAMLKRHGFSAIDGAPAPSEIRDRLRAVQDHPSAATLTEVIRRTQGTAVYDPDNIGHYGLALGHYAHFTSPIRRYPDLVVHRALKRVIAGLSPDASRDAMKTLGSHCSAVERRATLAERECKDRQRIAWLRDHLSAHDEITGRVDGMNDGGVFLVVGPARASVRIGKDLLPGAFFDGTAAWTLADGSLLHVGDEVTVVLTDVNVVAAKASAAPSGAFAQRCAPRPGARSERERPHAAGHGVGHGAGHASSSHPRRRGRGR